MKFRTLYDGLWVNDSKRMRKTLTSLTTTTIRIPDSYRNCIILPNRCYVGCQSILPLSTFPLAVAVKVYIWLPDWAIALKLQGSKNGYMPNVPKRFYLLHFMFSFLSSLYCQKNFESIFWFHELTLKELKINSLVFLEYFFRKIIIYLLSITT